MVTMAIKLILEYTYKGTEADLRIIDEISKLLAKHGHRFVLDCEKFEAGSERTEKWYLDDNDD